MKIRANVSKVNYDTPREEGKVRVVAYADIKLENCCRLNGMRVLEGDNGEFVSYPQKRAYEHGEPKLDENGKQVYTDIYFANSKESNDAIRALVLEAYHNDTGYAYLNPKEGERINAMIEPKLHACNAENSSVKAAGRLTIGGYMIVPDVFVHLRKDSKDEEFLSVDYPRYKANDGKYKDFVEPLEKGKIWDAQEKTEKEYNFRRVVESVMKKQTIEFHPELAHLGKAKVDDLIADAKDASEAAAGGKDKAEPAMEAAM